VAAKEKTRSRVSSCGLLGAGPGLVRPGPLTDERYSVSNFKLLMQYEYGADPLVVVGTWK